MKIRATGGAVGEIVSQGKSSAHKRDLIPRDGSLFDQLDLETLRPDAKTRFDESCTEEDMNLAGTLRVKDGE